jgi:leucyl-tRNA synthetase
MIKNYDHKKLEKKWQKEWEKKKIYKVKDKDKDRKNFYALVEFSYPSGNLHVGHWYAFGVTDIFARYKRMQGFNVLFPMGFDAFGLPAENAAINQGADPKVLTYKQMATMRTQLKSMGGMFDWEREVITCDPGYYKWTQWMFNKFFENDLVYRAVTKVNWCPKDKTILANEQVVDGCCDRCGSQVEQRSQEQWMIRITKFGDKLVDDLEKLDWPEEIKSAQRNWIGRSEGAEIDFSVGQTKIKVFTTRPDTILGATYIVLAPEHILVKELESQISNLEEVKKYITETKKKSDLDRQQSKTKTGVELKGLKAINPANKQEIPIYIADYVLAGYGTGAIMAVPADDERDREFAGVFGLPIVENYEKSGFEDYGKRKNTYRLRDWGISRQRYWGTPIPIVYDPSGKAHPVPDKHLPWLLPNDVDHTPDGTAPLARSKELFKRTEKLFGKGWKPEVETMDTFVDSSWYFYRYLDAKNKKTFADVKHRDAWMPIDLYMGGAEHTTMHLLYSRFWVKALHQLGLVKEDEAYKVRRNRGLILGPDGNKMSKSKGNVVDPDELVLRLGADTVRMYLAFMGPYGVTTNYPWDPNGVVGVRRFLERVWKIQEKVFKQKNSSGLLQPKKAEAGTFPVQNSFASKTLNKVIKKMTEDMAEYKFNTAISQMMVLMNEWEKAPAVSESEYKILLKLLAPFAPHMAEELWHIVGEKKSIHFCEWPVFDPAFVVDHEVKIAVQVNGKLRAELLVALDTTEEEVVKQALQNENVIKSLNGLEVKKSIYIKNRLINIVV